MTTSITRSIRIILSALLVAILVALNAAAPEASAQNTTNGEISVSQTSASPTHPTYVSGTAWQTQGVFGTDATLNEFSVDVRLSGSTSAIAVQYALLYVGGRQVAYINTLQRVDSGSAKTWTFSGLSVPVSPGTAFSVVLQGAGTTAISTSFRARGRVAAPEPTEVTPLAPTLNDAQCDAEKTVTVPTTTGVRYNQTRSGNIVTVTAVALDGYAIVPGAQTSWRFDVTPEPCSGGEEPDPDPSDPPGTNDPRFTVTPYNGIQLSDATTTGRGTTSQPYSTSVSVLEEANFQRAVVRVNAANSILAVENYRFNVDQIEQGVTLGRRVLSVNSDSVVFEVYPMKNGRAVPSARVAKDAMFTVTTAFTENDPNIDTQIDIYGTPVTTDPDSEEPVSPPAPVSPPDGANWVHKQIPNPELPQKCGLNIAIVTDLSGSLRYTNPPAFDDAKKAAKALVDALKNTPVEVGLYHFATNAPARLQSGKSGTTAGLDDPHLPVSDPANYEYLMDRIDEWGEVSQGYEGTNWDAGLAQVKGQGYDLVYFITDGNPTRNERGSFKGNGAFTSASDLNAAIDTANELKLEGTRIETILVDQKLGNGTFTPTRDYVLKDVPTTPSNSPLWDTTIAQPGALSYYVRGLEPNQIQLMIYRWNWGSNGSYKYWWNDRLSDGRNNHVVNIEQFEKDAASYFYVVKPDSSGQVKFTVQNGLYLPDPSYNVRTDKQQWTYGTRDFLRMAEDISGTGDATRVDNYQQLAAELSSMAQEIASLCEGSISIKKRIVNEEGAVVSDGENDWEFSIIANNPIIDEDAESNVVRSWKNTTTDSVTGQSGVVNWRLRSENPGELIISETQQEGYSIFTRSRPSRANGEFTASNQPGDDNAICTSTINGETTILPVTNDGVTGFRVRVPTDGLKVAQVACVVDNYKVPSMESGTVTIQKAEYNPDNPDEPRLLENLGGAEFKIYGAAAGGEIDYDNLTAEVTENNRSFDVDSTGTFYLVETRSPEGMSLLAEPVRFDATVDPDTGQLVIAPSAGTSPLISVTGSGKDIVLTVADASAGHLPDTGGRGVGLYALVGMVALVAAGALGWRKRATM